MRKRVLALFLVLAMALSTAALALPYGAEYEGYYNETRQQYSDVPTTHWAFQAVTDCSQRDWFDGYADGSFRPNQKITRAEAAKVFCKALGLENQSGTSFVDTKGHWAESFIEATKILFPNVQNLQGTSSFRPNQTITREETVYALVVAWRYASKTVNADWSVLNMYRDANSISTAIKPYMAVAVEEGLVSGFEDSTIRAQDGLTRAQFATLLYRALNHGYGPDSTTAPSIALDHYAFTTTDDAVTLSGRVTAESDSKLTLTCNGETVTLGKNGSFSITLALQEGENTFVFTATNLYGISASKTATITKEGAALPTLRLLSSLPERVSGSSIQVNGKINDYQPGHILTLDGKIVNVDSEGYFELELKLAVGTNTFELAVLVNGEMADARAITVTRQEMEGAGEWLEALPAFVNEEDYTIETKEQSRTRTRSVTKDTKPEKEGWTPDGTQESYIESWRDTGWVRENYARSETIKLTDEREVVDSKGYTNYTYYHYWAIKDGKTKMSYGNSYWKNYEEVTVTSPYPYYKTYDGKYDGYKSPSVPSGKHGTIWWLKGKSEVAAKTHWEYRYSIAVMGTKYGFYRWSDWSEWTDATATENDNLQVETRTLYRFTAKG